MKTRKRALTAAVLLAALLLLQAVGGCARPATPPEQPPVIQPEPEETEEPVQEKSPAGTFLAQQELWDRLNGMWFSRTEDGGMEFVQFTREGGTFYISTGLYLTDLFVRGATVSYQSDDGVVYRIACNMQTGALMSEEEEGGISRVEVTADISRLEREGLLLFGGAGDGGTREFVFAGVTLEEYDAYFYEHLGGE